MPGYLVTIAQSIISSDGCCYCMGFIAFLIDAVLYQHGRRFKTVQDAVYIARYYWYFDTMYYCPLILETVLLNQVMMRNKLSMSFFLYMFFTRQASQESLWQPVLS